MNKLTLVCLVGVVAFASAGLIKDETPEEKAEFTRVHKKCQDDPNTHVDEDLIKKMFEGIFTEDEQLKIHMECMAKGYDHMNEKGELNEEHLKKEWAQHYDGDDYDNLIKCLVVKGTPKQVYWEVIKCKHNTVKHLHKH